jgi:hypothetical protein
LASPDKTPLEVSDAVGAEWDRLFRQYRGNKADMVNAAVAEVVRLRQELEQQKQLTASWKMLSRVKGRGRSKAEAVVERLREALQRIEAGTTCTAKGVSSKHDEFCAFHVARTALVASPDKPPEGEYHIGGIRGSWTPDRAVGGEQE